MDLWVAVVEISPEVEAKIGGADHGYVSAEEVRQNTCWGHAERLTLVEDEDRGERLVARGGGIIVYLREIDRADGSWKCLTAWRL
jgi:hypothetical protein